MTFKADQRLNNDEYNRTTNSQYERHDYQGDSAKALAVAGLEVVGRCIYICMYIYLYKIMCM
jgi:hypothetical protein